MENREIFLYRPFYVIIVNTSPLPIIPLKNVILELLKDAPLIIDVAQEEFRFELANSMPFYREGQDKRRQFSQLQHVKMNDKEERKRANWEISLTLKKHTTITGSS